jgi:carbonic anhydrase
MDARVIPEYLLDVGEMNIAVIRNAGGRVQDAMRSLYTLVGVGGGGKGGLGCVAVIHHTDCGMMEFTDEHDRDMLRKYASPGAEEEIEKIQFGSFVEYVTEKP